MLLVLVFVHYFNRLRRSPVLYSDHTGSPYVEQETDHSDVSISLFCIKYTVKSLFVSDLGIFEQGKYSIVSSVWRLCMCYDGYQL